MIAPCEGSQEAVMARRAPRQHTALKVRITFEPHHGPPECVAHAYEHSVPGPRRTVARHAPATPREAAYTHHAHGGSRHVLCVSATPLSLRASRQINTPPRTPSPVRSPHGRSVSPWMGWSSQAPGNVSRKAPVAPHESGQRWSGSAMSAPPGPSLASLCPRRIDEPDNTRRRS